MIAVLAETESKYKLVYINTNHKTDTFTKMIEAIKPRTPAALTRTNDRIAQTSCRIIGTMKIEFHTAPAICPLLLLFTLTAYEKSEIIRKTLKLLPQTITCGKKTIKMLSRAIAPAII